LDILFPDPRLNSRHCYDTLTLCAMNSVYSYRHYSSENRYVRDSFGVLSATAWTWSHLSVTKLHHHL